MNRPPLPCPTSSLCMLALLAPLAACATPAVAGQTPSSIGQLPTESREPGTIRVSGQAQVQVQPDRVSISFGVETEAPSAREASRRNASEMDQVVSALRRMDLEGMEIETYGYALAPEYGRPSPEAPSRRVITGYRATNNIRVTAPEVDVAGEILDTGIGAGANRVVDLRFEATDTREARLEALRQAVQLAREEAQTMAEAMGVRLGPPLEVQGGAVPVVPPGGFRAMAFEAQAAPSTPIEAGTQTVSANVTIVYSILEDAR